MNPPQPRMRWWRRLPAQTVWTFLGVGIVAEVVQYTYFRNVIPHSCAHLYGVPHTYDELHHYPAFCGAYLSSSGYFWGYVTFWFVLPLTVGFTALVTANRVSRRLRQEASGQRRLAFSFCLALFIVAMLSWTYQMFWQPLV
jgi:hypothetical protein